MTSLPSLYVPRTDSESWVTVLSKGVSAFIDTSGSTAGALLKREVTDPLATRRMYASRLHLQGSEATVRRLHYVP